MMGRKWLHLIYISVLLVARSPSEPSGPSSLPITATVITVSSSPPEIAPTTKLGLTASATGLFSELPPLLEARKGKLRPAYVMEGNLWLLDEERKPVLLMQSGDVKQILFSPDGLQIVLSRRRDINSVDMWVVNSS
jgi:hypothetical protein